MRYLRVVGLALLLCGVALASPLDSDGDGYPDAVKLRDAADRLAFLEWFAAVAEAQYTAMADTWTERDCSGLLRFAFVQALKPKDAAWFAQFSYLPPIGVPPVRELSYPLPMIGRSVFRIAPGPFQADDVVAGRMVGLATAEELMRYASVPLGRTPEVARRGDLLFFAHPLAEGSGYHSMVYLGEGRVVYHTGLRPHDGGEVRLLSLAALAKHPDPSWHPLPHNPHFLGFFRWKIVY
jgi:uncharacterized protein YfaT (DUF1175 family)